MIKKIIFVIFACATSYTLYATQVVAESTVLINEFAIEPTQSVELINNSNETVDISNWYIDDSGGTTYFTVPQNSLLYPNSCLIFSSDFNLNKASADSIRLFDNTAPPTNASAKLMDSFSYNSSPGIGLSYLRQPDKSNNWLSGTSSFGKFNQTGENCLFVPTPTATPTPNPTSTPSPSPTLKLTEEPTITPLSSYNNIFISEVMIAPETGNKEWVELYNNNDFVVKLSNWYIDDKENAGASPKSFSLTIAAKSYASFDLAASMFNNDGDSVRLLDSAKTVKDSIEYISSTRGKTLGRISFEDDLLCIQEPTKEAENTSCIESPTPIAELPQISNKTIPTTIPTKQNLASNISRLQNPTGSAIDPTGSVLGFSTRSTPINQANRALAKPLSFLSFSYSILTIVSILLKMKFNV